MTRNYREAYGMFAVNGILFNHESPTTRRDVRDPEDLRAVAAIAMERQQDLYLGNLDAVRDWGYAPEYVEGMWRMLQHESPTTSFSPRVSAAPCGSSRRACFDQVGLDWEQHVRFDDRYFRPTEVDALIGDANRAQ